PPARRRRRGARPCCCWRAACGGRAPPVARALRRGEHTVPPGRRRRRGVLRVARGRGLRPEPAPPGGAGHGVRQGVHGGVLVQPFEEPILSGLPSHQNGMYGLSQAPGNFQSLAGVAGIPNLLNRAGYKTGIIGKYHVGPVQAYDFTYGLTAEHCWAGAIPPGGVGEICPSPRSDICEFSERSPEAYSVVSRNITHMKLAARQFLTAIEPERPFFLYVGFGDGHRCAFEGALGSFCEKFGSGLPGQGSIPDWSPRWFSADEVPVPWFLPDSEAVRLDIAAQCTSVNRMDQGIGLILDELESSGHTNDTLVLFFSDNGSPLPSAKTNLYEQGQAEPLVVAAPGFPAGGTRSSAVVSSLDFVPTMLSWAGIEGASPGVGEYSGSSLLPLLGRRAPPPAWRNAAFGSHSFHSLYAYYPMRSVVTDRYRLVHNLVHGASYPVLEDVYATRTWRELQRNGSAGEPTGWVYDFHAYLHRPEWELFDLRTDPRQQVNLARRGGHERVMSELQDMLTTWRKRTGDPWLVCSEASTYGYCTGAELTAAAAAMPPPPSAPRAELVL
ncbi:unnamed protein product, partial [Prorocentrum cordatum]